MTSSDTDGPRAVADVLTPDNRRLSRASPERAPEGGASLVVVEQPSEPGPLATLAPEVGRAGAYAAASRAENTRKAYASDLRSFAAWCAERGLCPLPAQGATVAVYLAHMADGGSKVSTIGRALVAISQAHKLAGHDSPRSHRAVQETFKGIRRTLGTAQKGKAPLMVDALRRSVEALPVGLSGLRDRAVLVLGFATAFRRTELVGLDITDLAFGSDGIIVDLGRCKTDQEGKGRQLGVPYGSNPATCPVRAVRAWVDAAAITSGPLFRAINRHGKVSPKRLSDGSVATIVKEAAERAGLDPKVFAGHSLRSGLATSAAKAGKSERAIMRTTGHKSVAMVRKYIKDAELFGSDNAASGIGL